VESDLATSFGAVTPHRATAARHAACAQIRYKPSPPLSARGCCPQTQRKSRRGRGAWCCARVCPRCRWSSLAAIVSLGVGDAGSDALCLRVHTCVSLSHACARSFAGKGEGRNGFAQYGAGWIIKCGSCVNRSTPLKQRMSVTVVCLCAEATGRGRIRVCACMRVCTRVGMLQAAIPTTSREWTLLFSGHYSDKTYQQAASDGRHPSRVNHAALREQMDRAAMRQ
jgi:hypothetical protein